MASQTNSFKLLEEEIFDEAPRAVSDIENNIQGQMRTVRLSGNIIELYLPRLVDLIISLFGGEPKEEDHSQRKESTDEEPGTLN